jgi:hypothetical protein
MDKMALELKHLAPYAPYGLKVYFGGKIRALTAISVDSKFVFFSAWIGSREKIMGRIENVQPILKPLSEFEYEHIAQIQVYLGLGKWCDAYDDYFDAWFNDAANVSTLVLQCPYVIMQFFLEAHFDVFGLIPKGLAIDSKTLS